MSRNRELFITAFALFSMFFGAGNLLLPPLLGYQASSQWPWVILGFVITAVVIPIIGIFAHARLQGSMFDFGKKVSPWFSSIFCVLIYAISVLIPAPRTAAATHEIVIFPNFGTSALLTSSIYFLTVLIFALNRTKILALIGKFLTPLIVLILLTIISIGLGMPHEATAVSTVKAPLIHGLLEGYQTFDAIGAIVIGGVIIVSLNLRGHHSFEEKKNLLKKSGWIAGLGLLTIYGGLILLGSYFSGEITLDMQLSSDMKRATLLRGISLATLGNIGTAFLSVLVALACFTTAVGITAGTADYVKGLCHNSHKAYMLTAVIACVLGIAIGQLDFHYIIVIAVPVLKFIYPITIVLIFLNVVPQPFAGPLVFKTVVCTTFVFGIFDALFVFYPASHLLIKFREFIPLGVYDFGWVFPALIVFVISGFLEKYRLKKKLL